MTEVVMLIPTYNRVEILEDCLSKLDKLDPQPAKYVFLENNSTDNTLKIIRNFNRPKEIIRLWFVNNATKRLDNPFAIMGIVRQHLLKKARQLNPDYAVFLDDDILVYTKDFIKRITSNGKDIVGGPYLRSSQYGMWLASVFWGKDEKGEFKGLRRNCKGLKKVCWTSTGCLCLSRKIIQDRRVNFVPLLEDTGEDFGYCIKASRLGYDVWLDCTVKLGHYARLDQKRPWMLKEGSEKEYVDFEYE